MIRTKLRLIFFHQHCCADESNVSSTGLAGLLPQSPLNNISLVFVQLYLQSKRDGFYFSFGQTTTEQHADATCTYDYEVPLYTFTPGQESHGNDMKHMPFSSLAEVATACSDISCGGFNYGGRLKFQILIHSL